MAVAIAVAADDAPLIESERHGKRVGCGQLQSRSLQESVRSPQPELSEGPPYHGGAGVNVALLQVIIQVPFRVNAAVLHAQARNDGRIVYRLAEKRDAGEIHCAAENVGLSGNYGAAKRGIEIALLCHSPGDDFAGWRRLALVGIRSSRRVGVCS